MSVGRNEACPCGSGKKYKKCCGNVTPITQIRSAREQKLRKEIVQWMIQLNEYVSNHVSEVELNQAREDFSAQTGLSIEDLTTTQWTDHFINYCVFDLKNGGISLVERFIHEEGKKMEREIKESLLRLTLGLYEIKVIEDDVLYVEDMASGEQRYVLTQSNVQAGQIIMGRLLNVGLRDLIFSGSMILQPHAKPRLVELIAEEAYQESDTRTITLYQLVYQQGVGVEAPAHQVAQEEQLLQRIYTGIDIENLRGLLEKDQYFELKKRDANREIWVLFSRKEEHLFPTLNHALLEMHEVIAELVIEGDRLAVEGFDDALYVIAQSLMLPEEVNTQVIDRLTSTDKKLTQGTLFVTSQPTLPHAVLQWAVQTYFSEKWLVTEQQELTGLPPILVAASNHPEMQDKLKQAVAKLETEASIGQGVARFIRMDLIKPRLALPNNTLSIENLLKRPLIEGLPESVFTVLPERLDEMALFVEEMTRGKSEATVKKYDETMSLFRSFVRSAFGPNFMWNQLSKEEVAYFLVYDVLDRIDSPSKTLANNLLSVLTAFFKWLDKRHGIELLQEVQELLPSLKEDLPEAYRLRTMMQKQVVHNLQDQANSPRYVMEEQLFILRQKEKMLLAKRPNGEEICIEVPKEALVHDIANWILAGVVGEGEEGTWQMFGTPDFYPPAVGVLLGVETHVLV